MADPIKLRDEETTILDKIYKWVILDKDVQNGPGTVVDLSNYYNKQYIDNLFNNLQVDVDLSNYYNKKQINDLLKNINVDLSNYYNKQQIDELLNNLDTGSSENLPAQYRINNQSEDYTTQELDFNGSTIIRCLKETDQVITITKPTDDFLGNTLTIRKVGWDNTSTVTILPGDGVTLLPADANVLRRSGSTVTLIYVEDGVFDVYGELA